MQVEELRELPVSKLHDVCEYLDIVFDKRKNRDPKKLADLIMGQRASLPSRPASASLDAHPKHGRHRRPCGLPPL